MDTTVQLVRLAKQHGIALRQSCEREGQRPRRRAGGYAHAKQFKRLKRVQRRQRTLLGGGIRDLQRRLEGADVAVQAKLAPWNERAQRLHAQRPKDKNKLYALRPPEVERIGEGKARQPYEFWVKVGIAVMARRGLIVGGCKPTTALVGPGYSAREVEGVAILHRGKAKSLTKARRRWLRPRQAIGPAIGQLKDDRRMDRYR